MMRRRSAILQWLFLLQYFNVHALERRQQEQIIVTPTTTSDFTVLAGTDYCCSNGISTMSSIATTKTRRKLSTQPLIGWSDPGDWVAYPVQLPLEGTYQVHLHVSSPFGDGGFELMDLQTQQIYATFDTMPVTTDWDTFETISLPVTLPAGLVSLQIRLLSAGWNLLWLAVTSGDSVGILPDVIVPEVVISPDAITTAPSVALTLDDVTILPTITTTTLGTIIPTPSITSPSILIPTPNVTSPSASIPTPTVSLPSTPIKPVVTPASTPIMSPTPMVTSSVITPVAPIASPVIATPAIPTTTTVKPPPHNQRPFLHEFITAESFTRYSPTIVWETSETEQRTQATALNTGDWMEFALAIPIAGPYQVHVRASSPTGEGSFVLVHVDAEMSDATVMNGDSAEIALGTFTGFTATGSWDEFTRIEQEIELPASPVGSGLLMRINILEPGFALLWLYVEPSDLWDAIDARDDNVI